MGERLSTSTDLKKRELRKLCFAQSAHLLNVFGRNCTCAVEVPGDTIRLGVVETPLHQVAEDAHFFLGSTVDRERAAVIPNSCTLYQMIEADVPVPSYVFGSNGEKASVYLRGKKVTSRLALRSLSNMLDGMLRGFVLSENTPLGTFQIPTAVAPLDDAFAELAVTFHESDIPIVRPDKA